MPQHTIANELTQTLRQAYRDWTSGAFTFSEGHYRLKLRGVVGPIASWDRLIKAVYYDVSEFNEDARLAMAAQKDSSAAWRSHAQIVQVAD